MFAARSALLTGSMLPPTVTSFSPTSAFTGRAFNLTINGANFVQGGTSVTVWGSSATVTAVTPTQITASVTGYSAGFQLVSVTTASGTVNAGYISFAVPMQVTSYYLSFANLYINGSGFSASTACYVEVLDYLHEPGARGYKSVSFINSGSIIVNTNYSGARGRFTLYDPVSGGTDWLYYAGG